MGSEDENIDGLSRRIQQAEAKPKPDASLTSASRVGWDFAGAVLGSGLIGALLDYTFSTSPWCLLVMVMIGFACGTLQAWRSIQDTDNDHVK